MPRKPSHTEDPATQKVSFNLPPDLAWKFKYASQMKGETQTQALISLLNKYISSYKSNIPPMPKKTG